MQILMPRRSRNRIFTTSQKFVQVYFGSCGETTILLFLRCVRPAVACGHFLPGRMTGPIVWLPAGVYMQSGIFGSQQQWDLQSAIGRRWIFPISNKYFILVCISIINPFWIIVKQMRPFIRRSNIWPRKSYFNVSFKKCNVHIFTLGFQL